MAFCYGGDSGGFFLPVCVRLVPERAFVSGHLPGQLWGTGTLKNDNFVLYYKLDKWIYVEDILKIQALGLPNDYADEVWFGAKNVFLR